jgi:DNA repair protein RecO (recombination protein O)
MLHKTRGIVFNSVEYGETSLVVKIYTELFGVQSYLINGVRKKHAKVHSNIFQLLTPLELVVYHKERPGIQRISEIRPSPQLERISSDIFKSSIIFFLDECLIKSIREEEPNQQLFEFLLQSIVQLDEENPVGKNFHLLFLLRLSKYLGFPPVNNYTEENKYFNLLEGKFQETFPSHPHFIPAPLSKKFFQLLRSEYSDDFTLTSDERRTIINYILEFYSLHLEGFGNIQSHLVLEEVWK